MSKHEIDEVVRSLLSTFDRCTDLLERKAHRLENSVRSEVDASEIRRQLCDLREGDHVGVLAETVNALAPIMRPEKWSHWSAKYHDVADRIDRAVEIAERAVKRSVRATGLQRNMHANNHDRVRSGHRTPSPSKSLVSKDTLGEDFAEVMRGLAKSVALSRLPVGRPSTFSGDAAQFLDWEAQFDLFVGSKEISPAEKLHMLRQFTSGVAKEAIDGFFLIPDGSAYEDARQLLKERYGHPVVVSNAFRDKLDKWRNVPPRDPAALRRFADAVSQCAVAARRLGGLSVLDDPRENLKLVNKLPGHLAHRWRRVAAGDQPNSPFPSFQEFSKWLSNEARIANNPLVLSSSSDQSDTKAPREHKARTFSTHAAQASACAFCKVSNHGIGVCFKFAKESIDQRRKFFQQNWLCYGCGLKGHVGKDCKDKQTCKKCKGNHLTSLHIGDTKPSTGDSESTPKETGRALDVMSSTNGHMLAMIVPVKVYTGGNSSGITTYAMLDSQSDCSFISNGLAERLRASGTSVSLGLTTMSNTHHRINCKKFTSLSVRGIREGIRVPIPAAYGRDYIPANREHIPTPSKVRRHPHLAHIAPKLSSLLEAEVGLLIGYNCPQALAPIESVVGDPTQPFAQKTVLGWSVVGVELGSALAEGDCVGMSHRIATIESTGEACEPESASRKLLYRSICHERPVLPAMDDIIKVLARDFSEMKEEEPVSREDRQFLSTLKEGVHFDDKGYCTLPLPFRNRPPEDNQSLQTAHNRFRSLTQKFKRDEEYRTQYHSFMQDIISAGEAEAVPANEADKGWYIPHFGIRHPRKKKLRVVYDCSAKADGVSLNDYLIQGPDLLNSLVGILMRFRVGRVAFACDVRRMFHMFRVTPEDRDFLRFLWLNAEGKTVPYRMTVHLFGATSSPGCATYGLRHVVRASASESVEDKKAVEFVERDFYVDDGLTSIPTSEEAIELFQTAKQLMSRGNVRLHKVLSNDSKFLESISTEDRSLTADILELGSEELCSECTLGLQWNLVADRFEFSDKQHTKPDTRRGILSTVMSIFDPLGLISPCVLGGKTLLQEMCRSKSGWDESISPELSSRWEGWLGTLKDLSSLSVDRCHEPPEFGSVVVVEFHHFADASETGYGACSYVRLVNKQGVVHCSLVFGKSRVAPLKATTIPRLELQAAVTAAKLGTFIDRELGYRLTGADHHYWSDSQVVLAYIGNDAKRYHTFVANRIQAIRDSTTPEQWHHVSGVDNPADLASRGATPKELMETRWFSGPALLWDTEISYPEQTLVSPELTPEYKICRATSTREQDDLLSRLDRFSSWHSVIRGFSVLTRCARRKKGLPSLSLVEERDKTAHWLVKLSQERSFGEERESLADGGSVSKRSRLSQLDPFLDPRGVLRVGGRLRRSIHLSHEQAHPVILPKQGRVTELVMKHAHVQVAHLGRGTTFQKARDLGYWVLGGRTVASGCIHQCVTCKRLRGIPHSQKMADLPQDRVDPAPPFAYSGCDVFGPFQIKEGRQTVKRYGLMFTCLASRAIHLEMLRDMTADGFVNATRRLQALRGPVRHLRCDQGTNFVGAASEMKRQITDLLGKQGCDFIFNPPHASHMGGVWERQIRSARSALSGLLTANSGRLDSEAFHTLLYECAYLVNSRPLSVEESEDPFGEPITPNMLLQCRSEVLLPPPGDFESRERYGKKRWRQVQALTNAFWSRWSALYLRDRQSRSKWTASLPNLKVDDVVLVVEDGATRGHWKTGRVVDVKCSEDGLVRSANVRMPGELDRNGRPKGAPRVYERPIHRLIPLMIS